LLCLLNLGHTLRRSTLPLRLEGTVTALEVRREKKPGIDDVHLLWLGRRVIEVDPAVTAQLRPGERISKRAWDREIQTPRGPVRLKPSRDFWGMAVVMPALAALTGWLLERRRGQGTGKGL